MLADFPDTITVGDVATRHGVLFGVTASATRPARDTIIGTCRGYVAWADGVPVDSFDLYVHDGQIEAWKSDTFSPDRRAIRAAAALALNARANCDVRPPHADGR